MTKVAVIIGAGQSPGEGMGNGRAVATLFAREGASVLAVDRDGDSAAETAQLINDAGGRADSCVADVVDETSLQRQSMRQGEMRRRNDSDSAARHVWRLRETANMRTAALVGVRDCAIPLATLPRRVASTMQCWSSRNM